MVSYVASGVPSSSTSTSTLTVAPGSVVPVISGVVSPVVSGVVITTSGVELSIVTGKTGDKGDSVAFGSVESLNFTPISTLPSGNGLSGMTL